MGLRSLSLSQAQAGEGVGSCSGGLCLRRREGGGGVRWRLWNWIWSCCKGIGDKGVGCVRRVKGRRRKV